MGMTPTYLLPYPELADQADAQAAVKPLADRLEAVLPTLTPPAPTVQVGLYATRPAANTVAPGTTFYASDTLGAWASVSNAWVLIAQGRPRITGAQLAAAPFTAPYDNQQVMLDASPELVPLVYYASVGKWLGQEWRAWSLSADHAQTGGGLALWGVNSNGVLFPYGPLSAAGLKLQVRNVARLSTPGPSAGGFGALSVGTIGGNLLAADGSSSGSHSLVTDTAHLTGQVNTSGNSNGVGQTMDSGWLDLNAAVVSQAIMGLYGYEKVSAGAATTRAGSAIFARWSK